MEELLEKKLNDAVEQFNQVNNQVQNAEEQLTNLKNAREQLRGSVVTLQQLIDEGEKPKESVADKSKAK